MACTKIATGFQERWVSRRESVNMRASRDRIIYVNVIEQRVESVNA